MLTIVNFGPSKRAITGAVTAALNEQLDTKVNIGALEIGLFNRILLRDVTLLDKRGETLLQAHRMTAKIELRSLFRHRLAIRTISLLDARIDLYQQQEGGPTNIQFLIDAFSSKDKKKPSTLDLRINSLILRRVAVSYHARYRERTPRLFNPAHIDLSDIDASISLKYITPDSLRLRVRRLAFKEGSGVTLKNLTFKLIANRREASVEDFLLELPHSYIHQEKLQAAYDATNGWNRLWPTLQLRGKANKAHIAATDLLPFLNHPRKEKLQLTAEISTQFTFTPAEVQLRDIRVRELEQGLSLRADATLRKADKSITNIALTLRALEARPQLTGHMLDIFAPNDTLARCMGTRLGTIKADGSMIYRLHGPREANINCLTEIGKISAEACWKGEEVKSRFALTSVNPARLFARPDLPTLITISGNARIGLHEQKLASVAGDFDILRLLYRQHLYQDIALSGSYREGCIEARLRSGNPEAKGTADVRLQMAGRKPSLILAQLNLQHFAPAKLGISTPYGPATFSGRADVSLHGLASQQPRGHLTLSDIALVGNPRGDFRLTRLEANLEDSPAGGNLRLRSDFLDADLNGPLSPKVLMENLQSITARCLPGLLPKAKTSNKADGRKWNVNLTLRPTDAFERLLGKRVTLKSPFRLHGTLDGGSGRTALSGFVEGIAVGSQQLGHSSLFLEGQGTDYHCLVQTHKEIRGYRFSLVADLLANDGNLRTDIGWGSAGEKNYNGNVRTLTRFNSDADGVNFDMTIDPTQFHLADSVWQIASGRLSLHRRTLAFNNVSLSHADQLLSIDGRIAPGQNDSIVASFRRIDIDYILGLVNFDAVSFGGKATGQATLTKADEHPQLHARLEVPDFTFNDGQMGHARINGSWSKRDNRIVLDADMCLQKTLEKPESRTQVKGFVDLAQKGLELNIDADHTNLRLLRRYMDGIFADFEGDATGFVKIYGPFKKLDFEGDMKANAEARIEATGVKYNVTDGDVTLRSGLFGFSNFNISDGRGGRGRAQGELRHTHLKHLRYDFNVEAERLLCYDQPQSPDLPFYSTTTGTGKVHLQGLPGRFMADISLRPDAPTTLVYNLGTPGTISTSDSMIRFHEKKEPAEPIGEELVKEEIQKPVREEQTTDIVLNLYIDTNPHAEVKILTDPRSGDAITVYGSGPIRAVFHNKGSFEMYGTYRLQRGTYKLSLQDVIRKDLTLREGSTITFAGDPLQANLNLKAAYTLNSVSLSDLNYGAGFGGKTVRVDCLLNIGGKAAAPQVNFDLDLHNISSDEKQMVRQLIATEEDMNRQVIYLLGIGRFYTANTQNSVSQTTSQQQSAAAMRSFLSSTLTGQLNTAISSAMGNQSNWSFGTNVAPGTLGWSDIEVDGLLQGRLFNDRLLINGNFGYRDRPTYTSNFVGDFDIRYLLTPKGNISLKAYSETTDRYFTKSSLTTQGVGITMQRDFNNLHELFQVKRKSKKKATKRGK